MRVDKLPDIFCDVMCDAKSYGEIDLISTEVLESLARVGQLGFGATSSAAQTCRPSAGPDACSRG